MHSILNIVVLFLCTKLLPAHKILVYNPKFAFSHMRTMGVIADTLQNAGNNVTVLQYIVIKELKGTGSNSARVVAQEVPNEISSEFKKQMNSVMGPIWKIDSYNPSTVIGPVIPLQKLFTSLIRYVMDQEELITALRKEQFDIGITEIFDLGGLAFLHAAGVKTIVGAHTTSIFEGTSLSMGIPIIPSYVPAAQGFAGDDTSLSTRAMNLIFTYVSYAFQERISRPFQNILKEKYGQDAPNLWDIISQMPLVITHSDPLLDFSKPTQHRVIDVGGIAVHKPKPLVKFWSNIVSKRRYTVLMSFGSIAPSSLMPQAMKDSILAAIRRMPEVTFIWKYETPEDNIGDGVENLILSKWTPQTDLLSDDHLSLFITHGGVASVYEATHRGKALIVVPLFGDQKRNGLLVEKHGFGFILDKSQLFSTDAVVDAVRRGLNDKSLHSNAALVARLISFRPFDPQDILVRHVALAAEFGTRRNSVPTGTRLNYIQYHNIDIIIIFVFCFIIILTTILFIVTKIIKLIVNRFYGKKTKKMD